jgi:PEP-CTERM motif
MRLRLASLTLVLAVALAAPAMATTIYSNGPINGTINAWGFWPPVTEANSFVVSTASTVTAFDLGIWDTAAPTTVDWAISAGNPSFLGGTPVANGSGTFANTYLGSNGYGYDVYSSTITGLSVPLTAGTYYLELSNGQGGAPFWDENDGASTAYYYYNGLGQPTGSEAFTVYGGATPEPGSLILLGSGVLGLAGMLRRKINL